jgi:hypothetical protein
MEETQMPSLDAGYVVVDLWRVKPGKEDDLKSTMARLSHLWDLEGPVDKGAAAIF